MVALPPVLVAYGTAFLFAVVVLLLGLFSQFEKPRRTH
jgi:hypothetical protein